MLKRILIIFFSTLSVLLIGLYFSYDYWLEKELKYRLSEIISKDPNSLYRYNFDKLNIDLIDGSVDLKGIKIEPRQRGFDSLTSTTNPVRFLLQLNMEKIELQQFEIMEFISTSKIVVESIYIDQPSISYYYNPNKEKAKQKMPLSEVFSDKFMSANIKNFVMNDGQLKIDNYNDPDPALSINYLDIKLTDAYMDKKTLENVAPIDYDEIELTAGSISADISENFSIISDSLLFNAAEESFLIRDFQIKPKYSMENWASNHKVQAQWFALTLRSLSLRNIDLENFVRTGEIKVGRVRVRKPNVALYKDKRQPEPVFKKKALPATAIRSIPLKLQVDSVEIIDGYVAIKETSKLTGLDSHISFYNLNGILTNFSNMPENERVSNVMELSASTLMYNKAPIRLNMKFNLNSTDDQFSAVGTVDSVDFNTFNPVLEPMMAVKIRDGRLHNMTFHFDAMDTSCIGTLDMSYNNAKIEVLQSDTSSSRQRKGFMSFAANTIIKTNNDVTKPSYVQGIISTNRVLNKDVWPYLWHSVQSGIVSTLVPITNDKETKQQQKLRKQQLKQERKEGKD